MELDRFDFVWVFEGWDVLRARELDGVEISTLRFIDYTDCIPDWYTPVIATSDLLIGSDPDLVSAFLKATARGYDYAMEHPDEAAMLLLQAVPELDQGLVEASAAYLGPRYADAGEPWGVQEAAIWERFEAFLYEAGITEAELDTSDVFTNEFLP
jgi:ABC-type nitrate/sulfonate/bicarbonate transport system substrate-binding protein